MKPSLSNCDEVPEVHTRLTKLHIPSAELPTLTATSAHGVLRHRGFVGTNEMREVFLYLKSLWNVSHLLELQFGSSRGLRRSVWGILGLQHHTRADVCRLQHTLTVSLCDSWYNVISSVPRVSDDDGDFWVMLCLLATAMTGKKIKLLSMMISGIFHTTRRSLRLCLDANTSLTEACNRSRCASDWAHLFADKTSSDFNVLSWKETTNSRCK